ncbi:unnamed protein product, partial [Anisakis simplex]|uniref:Tudor domain-containing protein n=1 Tax=Anisakis simplex TaxID=6269 RepID=A0A0M3KD00_ANISI
MGHISRDCPERQRGRHAYSDQRESLDWNRGRAAQGNRRFDEMQSAGRIFDPGRRQWIAVENGSRKAFEGSNLRTGPPPERHRSAALGFDMLPQKERRQESQAMLPWSNDYGGRTDGKHSGRDTFQQDLSKEAFSEQLDSSARATAALDDEHSIFGLRTGSSGEQREKNGSFGVPKFRSKHDSETEGDENVEVQDENAENEAVRLGESRPDSMKQDEQQSASANSIGKTIRDHICRTDGDGDGRAKFVTKDAKECGSDRSVERYGDLWSRIKSRIDIDALIGKRKYVKVIRSDASENANPTSFCVQLSSDKELIDELSLDDMPKCSSKLNSPEPGMLCMAPYFDIFYRARILQLLDEGTSMLVKGKCANDVYEVQLQLADTTGTVSDALCERGLTKRVRWPSRVVPLYSEQRVLRSDNEANVQRIFTVQLRQDSEALETIAEQCAQFIERMYNRRTVDKNDETSRMVDGVHRLDNRSFHVGDVLITNWQDFPYRAEVVDIVDGFESASRSPETTTQSIGEDGDRKDGVLGESVSKETDVERYRLRYVDYGNEDYKQSAEMFCVDWTEDNEVLLDVRNDDSSVNWLRKDEQRVSGGGTSECLQDVGVGQMHAENIECRADGHQSGGHTHDEGEIEKKTDTVELMELDDRNTQLSSEPLLGSRTHQKVTLASLLLEKGLAQRAAEPTDFPIATRNSFSWTSAEDRNMEMRILGVGLDGKTLLVRPKQFDGMYAELSQ